MIIINDKFKIDQDTYNWILIYKRDGVNLKTGEPSVTEHSLYFSTFGQCLQKFVDMSLKEVNGDLTDILNELKRLNEFVDTIGKNKFIESIKEKSLNDTLNTIINYNGSGEFIDKTLQDIAMIYYKNKSI